MPFTSVRAERSPTGAKSKYAQDRLSRRGSRPASLTDAGAGNAPSPLDVCCLVFRGSSAGWDSRSAGSQPAKGAGICLVGATPCGCPLFSFASHVQEGSHPNSQLPTPNPQPLILHFCSIAVGVIHALQVHGIEPADGLAEGDHAELAGRANTLRTDHLSPVAAPHGFDRG